MNDDQQRRDSQTVLEHLRHLPILGGIAARLDELIQIAKQRKTLRAIIPGVTVGGDIHFNFDPVAIYIDNTQNANPITIQFDNEVITYQIDASKGRFLPCTGAKQFRISGTIAAAANVNVLYTNYDMNY